MKLHAFAILFGVLMTTVAAGSSEISPPPQRSDSGLQSDLDDDKLASATINCLLDRGDCTNEGLQTKRMMTHIIETKCDGCTKENKEAARKLMKILTDEKPELWEEIKKRYDPDDSRLENFRSFLEDS